MTSSLAHRHEIDGLRGVAVLAVILFHANVPVARGGFIGVDVFFVISGYLITGIIWSDLQHGKLSIAHFFERRARRLLPALIATCMLTALAGSIILAPPDLAELGRYVLAANLFVANILAWLHSGYFTTQTEHLPLIHTWSLSVEEQYYLIAPFALIALRRRGRAVVVAVLGMTGLLSLALAQHLSTSPGMADASFFLLPTRAWELAAGSLVALLRREIEAARAHLPQTCQVLACIGIGMVGVSFLVITPTSPHPGLATTVPVGGTCLVLAFATATTLAARALSWRVLVQVGLASFSIYLCHQPILALSRNGLARELTPAETALALALAVAFGFAMWRWVEQPFRRPAALAPRAVAAAGVSGLTGLLAVGGVIVWTDGLPQRMEPRVNALTSGLKDGGRVRFAGIRAGTCHYNRTVRDLEKFLADWDCLPRSTRFPILVVGDSTGADKAWVMREAGFDVGNIGGSGCPILPPADTRDPCWHVLTKARQIVREGRVSGLVLSRHWSGAMSAPHIEAIVDYWREPGVAMLIVSEMPHFTDFLIKAVKLIREGRPLDSVSNDDRAADEHERSLGGFERLGVTVLNSRRLLCGDIRPCSAFRGTTPLVSDAVHLQPEGARLMAERLRRDPVWLHWLAQLQPRDNHEASITPSSAP